MTNYNTPTTTTSAGRSPRDKVEDYRTRPARAAIYIRARDDTRALEISNVSRQRRFCRQEACRLGATVAGEYIDTGVRANDSQRPGLRQLLSRLKQQPRIDYVIVRDLDRLARNCLLDLEIRLAIHTAGAKLVAHGQTFDESPAARLTRDLISLLAPLEGRSRAEATQKGRERAAESGRTPSRTPLGYLKLRWLEHGRQARTVAIDPVRGPIMRWAFEAYASGEWSIRDLLEEADRRGLTTVQRGRPARSIRPAYFQQLLAHPYYIGIVRYAGGEYTGRHRPLVTLETWQRVQEVLTAESPAATQNSDHSETTGRRAA